MTFRDRMTVEIGADTSRLRAELLDAQRMAEAFGRSITRAFDGAALKGAKLSDVLRSVALELSRLALKAALKPLEAGLGNLLGGLTGSLQDLFGSASKLKFTPFARGGVVGAPALFPLDAGRLGLAGEAGAEAILPLARGADGRLGVRAGGGRPQVSVTFNVTTPDAASFRGSETQIGAMLGRIVARGERNI